MLKTNALALCVCLFSLAVNAQNSEISRILEEVEQNNNELKAFASRMEGKQLELKTTNNLSNPQVDAYYLPLGNHSSGDYTEFQISQSFEFPTVYSARKNLIEEQFKGLELTYASKKQEVLLTAKKYCVELISLNKILGIEQARIQQAKQVFDQVSRLYESDQVGILTINKAKIAWLQEQFSVQKIELQRQSLLAGLKNINGGNPISMTSVDLADSYRLADFDSLWHDKLNADPHLISLQQKEAIALQESKLSKNKTLPNLNAGFNRQGFAGEYYSGIYGGISIPLFGNRNKVKSAEATFQFQESYSNVLALQAKAEFEKLYNEYTLLLERFEEYDQTLKGLNSEALLLGAYELGAISFMEFYVELQFYRQALDSMVDMEKQLNLLKADLLKHQL
ncbi:MAG: TolC family protein [Flavobacteriales bacterium]|nr:TolC family protein [Flavobacteriales bacterium]